MSLPSQLQDETKARLVTVELQSSVKAIESALRQLADIAGQQVAPACRPLAVGGKRKDPPAGGAGGPIATRPRFGGKAPRYLA